MAKTILLVEDDVALAKMYSTKFALEGFNVKIARTGEEGLNMALTEKPDLILLDMMLPKISGDVILQKIKNDPNAKNIPVIVLSNLTVTKEAQEAVRLGAKEYLAKAMHTPEQIVEKVKKYI